MSKKNILFIINPIAGVRSKMDIPSLIEQHIDKSVFEVQVRITQYAGHGEELASEFVSKNIDVIVAVGGDGTINEVAKPIIGTKTILGIVPLGSGNGLGRHLNIPLNPENAILNLNNFRSKIIDTCLLNGRPFLCTAGVGFDAEVSALFAQKKTRGISTYIKSVLEEINVFKPSNYSLVLDGFPMEVKAFSITLANAAQYGNNAYISPLSDISDGIMDVCILSPFPKWKSPFITYKIFNKSIQSSTYYQVIRCQKAIIKSTNTRYHIDGEPILLTQEVEAKIVPNSLTVLV